MPALEVACFEYDAAIAAANNGAHRIEFATNYAVGGITPNLKSLKQVLNNVSLPVQVLMRCKPGNFVYSTTELLQMEADIKDAADMGAAGLVFGCLHPNNTIDVEANQQLLAAAQGLPCTFHRAFDTLPNYSIGLNQIMLLGFNAILTAGSSTNAWEGRDTLAQLLVQTEQKIDLICGGGIRSNNLAQLLQTTNANWFHSACITSQTQALDTAELSRMLAILAQNNTAHEQ
jgi:copper homeostasis protein